MKPFRHRSGRWCIHYPPRLSPTGKDKFCYFDSEEAAESDLKQRKVDVAEHGKSFVTAGERQWVLYLRNQIGDLDKIPAIVEHWKKTGSVTPMPVQDAVAAFHKWQLPRVSRRTASDIRWRLLAFAEAFHGRLMHQFSAGELELWLYQRGAEWSVRSFYKRMRPLFDFAVRHQWLSDNPLLKIKSPDVPRKLKSIYTGEQFQNLLYVADCSDNDYLLPFIALTGFAWMRTGELVREYLNENVLCWEDIDWERKRIHVKENVAKQTSRKSGNERLVPMTDLLLDWLSIYRDKKGMIVPLLAHDFDDKLKTLHTEAKVPQLKNGLRRSAISYYLAANPDVGHATLARWAGHSDSTMRGYYLEFLTPEQGAEWFEMGRSPKKP